jgi:hypothetical protein
MYARIARFEGGDTSQMEAVIDGSREMIDSTFDSPPRAWRERRRCGCSSIARTPEDWE